MVLILVLVFILPTLPQDKTTSVSLEDLTWFEAEKALEGFELESSPSYPRE